MVTLLLFLYFVGLFTINEAIIDFQSKKPIMCGLTGTKWAMTPTNFSSIPSQCEIVVITDCDPRSSNTGCDLEIIKGVVSSKYSVILDITRPYGDWLDTLKPDGNAADAQILIDFATKNGAMGVILNGLGPRKAFEDVTGNLACNIASYIQQLKSNPEFIVGINLAPFDYILNNSSVIDYEASNDLLNFYVLNTYQMNTDCDSTLFNGNSPIHEVADYDLYTLDDVVATIQTTKMSVDKIYFVIDLQVFIRNDASFASYEALCTTKNNITDWCAPTTKDYYDKAKFLHDGNYGILVYWIEMDDSQNSCGCCPHIGFQNIAAGYTGGTQQPCSNFDIKEVP